MLFHKKLHCISVLTHDFTLTLTRLCELSPSDQGLGWDPTSSMKGRPTVSTVSSGGTTPKTSTSLVAGSDQLPAVPESCPMSTWGRKKNDYLGFLSFCSVSAICWIPPLHPWSSVSKISDEFSWLFTPDIFMFICFFSSETKKERRQAGSSCCNPSKSQPQRITGMCVHAWRVQEDLGAWTKDFPV